MPVAQQHGVTWPAQEQQRPGAGCAHMTLRRRRQRHDDARRRCKPPPMQLTQLPQEPQAGVSMGWQSCCGVEAVAGAENFSIPAATAGDAILLQLPPVRQLQIVCLSNSLAGCVGLSAVRVSQSVLHVPVLHEGAQESSAVETRKQASAPQCYRVG